MVLIILIPMAEEEALVVAEEEDLEVAARVVVPVAARVVVPVAALAVVPVVDQGEEEAVEALVDQEAVVDQEEAVRTTSVSICFLLCHFRRRRYDVNSILNV